MERPYTLTYPVEIKTDKFNEYHIQSIDYPECKYKSKSLSGAIKSVRDQLEETTWIDSSNNTLKLPSSISASEKINNLYSYAEIEITRRYKNLPEKLYYYLSFSEIAIDMLLEPYIWFSDPTSFNDPFELPDVFEYKWSAEQEWLDFKFAYETHKNKLEILKRYKTANDAYLDLKLNSPEVLFKIIRMKISSIEDVLSSIGVSCFSRYYDNILMWSHYSKKHTGIVIGYDYQTIINTHKSMMGGDIDYRHKLKKIETGKYSGDIKNLLKSEYTTRKLFTKHPQWSYEQEFRLLNDKGHGKYMIPKECISEIYFGCNIDKNIRKTLLGISNKLDIKVYEMEKSESNELIRNEYKKTR